MIIKNTLDKYCGTLARVYRIARDAQDPLQGSTPIALNGNVLVYGEAKNSIAYRVTSNEMSAFELGLSSSDLFVDVGANIGLFSCCAAKRGVPTISIEPSIVNLKILYENILLNDLINIEVLPIAMSREPGVKRLYGGGQGASLIDGWGGIAANYSTYVSVNCLDRLILERCQGKRVLIKVDVEGSEFDVLQGGQHFFEMSPAPMLIIEIGFQENFMGGINPHYNEIFNFLFSKGYDCYAIELKRKVTMQVIKSWIETGTWGFYALNFYAVKNTERPSCVDFFGALE